MMVKLCLIALCSQILGYFPEGLLPPPQPHLSEELLPL